MDFPNRKQVRLQDYDYSAPGAYFVTVCTQNRRCILSHIAVGADALGGPNLTLTETGKTVEKYILSSDRIAGLHVDKFVIMPNHIHLLLRIDGLFAGADGGPPRSPPNHIHLLLRIDGLFAGADGGPPRSPWPGPYICDHPQRDRRIETPCAPGRGADSFPAFLSRARDPGRGGLSGDLALHRHKPRQMGGGAVLSGVTPPGRRTWTP